MKEVGSPPSKMNELLLPMAKYGAPLFMSLLLAVLIIYFEFKGKTESRANIKIIAMILMLVYSSFCLISYLFPFVCIGCVDWKTW